MVHRPEAEARPVGTKQEPREGASPALVVDPQPETAHDGEGAAEFATGEIGAARR